MKHQKTLIGAALTVFLAALALTITGCYHLQAVETDGGTDGDSDGDTDGDTDGDSDGDTDIVVKPEIDGVDMLLVVDNSHSMKEEQTILATSFFQMVNALAYPLPGWDYPPVDDLRIAVVSSDMGMSWGGNPYKEGDGLKYDHLFNCTELGDEGQFKNMNNIDNHINLAQDFIYCSGNAAQCPEGWECIDSSGSPVNNTVGFCHDPSGNGTYQKCPTSPYDLGMDWITTSPDAQNANLALTTACISNLGTNGCGFEQQLQSAITGLTRSDQKNFIRDNKLLVVLVVSDEEDCSIKDGPGFFTSSEMQDVAKLNIACGADHNQKFLYSSKHFVDSLRSFKKSNSDNVLFAAIVGVPYGADSICQGDGTNIGDCLDYADMQLTEQSVIDENGKVVKRWNYACERGTVTRAYPGRRYVEIAEEFGNMGYIYSICNEDWSSAMENIAKIIASKISK